MSNIKLFRIETQVTELPASTVALERDLQVLIEQNMIAFFGVTFLKSEFVTSHGGRIDSLGIDENFCPVIFEYKRSSNENVINQGLFYLDWLLDHKADFEILVMKQLGKETSDKVDWTMPRLICVAGNFTRYDEYAVKQINRNIDLVRYIRFGDGLILMESINSTTVTPHDNTAATSSAKKTTDKTFEEQLRKTSHKLHDLYYSIRDYILSLGDDISENQLKLYVAFKKIRNIICVEVYQKQIILYLRLNPDEITLEDDFTRDMRGVGHFGTGDLQVIIKSKEDFEKAKPFIEKAYLNN